MKQVFQNPSKGELSLEEVVKEVADFIQSDASASYGLVIGTDSHSRRLKKKKSVDFVTAIVIHRHGKGGRYFWQKRQKDKVFSLRDKIYTETLYSVEAAKDFVPKLKTSLNSNAQYDLEIHIDIGEFGPTREMIREIVGMVRGNGLVPKIKPSAYAASVVADKHA